MKGFQELRAPSGIAGVIFNRVPAAVYAQLKPAVEAACGVSVYGHLPDGGFALESRHLGLVNGAGGGRAFRKDAGARPAGGKDDRP